jgi:hypothetical protein
MAAFRQPKSATNNWQPDTPHLRSTTGQTTFQLQSRLCRTGTDNNTIYNIIPPIPRKKPDKTTVVKNSPHPLLFWFQRIAFLFFNIFILSVSDSFQSGEAGNDRFKLKLGVL